jgi:lipid-A-disaccharide synthase
MVASGTATLEAFLMGTPQVVAYKTSRVTSFLARCLVRIPRVSLPNILAGRDVVEELLQEDLTPERLAESLMGLLGDEERKKEYRKAGLFAGVSLRGREASRLAARAVMDSLMEKGKGTFQ